MVEAGRERKGPLDGRTLRTTGTLLYRLRMEKGGQLGEGRQTQARARNSLGCPAGEESVDKRWRPVGGGAVQVDGCSAPVRDGVGEAGAKRNRGGVDG